MATTQTRTCRACKAERPIEEFKPISGRYYIMCPPCRRIQELLGFARSSTNPDVVKTISALLYDPVLDSIVARVCPACKKTKPVFDFKNLTKSQRCRECRLPRGEFIGQQGRQREDQEAIRRVEARGGKRIPDFPNYYAMPSGHIHSVSRWAFNGTGWRWVEGRQRATSISNTGYECVGLYHNGASRTLNVHVLVFRAFHGEIPAGEEVMHVDQCKLNNRPDNLTTGTRAENLQHALDEFGNWSDTHKLSLEKAREIRRRRAQGEAAKSLAQAFGVRLPTIYRILSHQTYKEPLRDQQLRNRFTVEVA